MCPWIYERGGVDMARGGHGLDITFQERMVNEMLLATGLAMPHVCALYARYCADEPLSMHSCACAHHSISAHHGTEAHHRAVRCASWQRIPLSLPPVIPLPSPPIILAFARLLVYRQLYQPLCLATFCLPTLSERR